MNKRKLVLATPELIAEMFKSTKDCVFFHIEGVPKDAQYIGITHSNERNCFYICFEHDSFENIPFGDKIPIIKIKFTKYNYLLK